MIKVRTQDSVAVFAVAVNSPTQESDLVFLENPAWRTQVQGAVADPDRVVVTDARDEMRESIEEARTGSELWPLFIVLAVLFAVSESLVSRFMAQEGGGLTSP